jgi:CheY-like chemotaxis protein
MLHPFRLPSRYPAGYGGAIRGKRMKVLVVEDDDLVRMVTVDALEDAGFEVIEATTGEEAMARCEDRIADVLFTDIMLPGNVTGWDVAEHCRKVDPYLPVVYATGHSFAKPKFVPGSRLLCKPFGPAHVVEVITEAIKQRSERPC